MGRPNGNTLIGGLVRKLFALLVLSMTLSLGGEVLNATAIVAHPLDVGWLKTAFDIALGAFVALIDPKEIKEFLFGAHQPHEPKSNSGGET